jgi:hypothetical protein
MIARSPIANVARFPKPKAVLESTALQNADACARLQNKVTGSYSQAVVGKTELHKSWTVTVGLPSRQMDCIQAMPFLVPRHSLEERRREFMRFALWAWRRG